VEPELNGRCAAELMAKFVPPNSGVAIVTGMLQVEDHRRKTEGFCQAFPRFCAGGKIIEIIENHEDAEEARQKCASLLDRFPSLGGLYVSTAKCLPVCAALNGAGLSGRVKVIATDLFPRMARYIKNGTIAASMYQHPHRQGQTAVRVAVDHIVNGVPILPSYYLTPQIVLQSNLSLFREISSPKATERTVPASGSADLGPLAAVG
jgi:LacI family transcriptional regulator